MDHAAIAVKNNKGYYDVSVHNVCLDLLKTQRDAILRSISETESLGKADAGNDHVNDLEGLLNLLDDILDSPRVE